MLLATVLAGLAFALRPKPPKADLVVWTFAQTYFDAFTEPDDTGQSVADYFEDRTGLTVEVRLIDRNAIDLRLIAGGDDVADVVQLEVQPAAKFLEAPGDWFRAFEKPTVRSDRWDRDGITWGLPMDVHPVALAYRKDLLDEAGIDVRGLFFWEGIERAAADYQRHVQSIGQPNRKLLEMSPSKSDQITLLMQMCEFSPDDVSSNSTLRLIEKLGQLYQSGQAGPTTDGHGLWARDFVAGEVAMLWMPDWRLKYLELSAPELAGKVGLMQVPLMDFNAPVPTWGGTALFVPTSAHPAAEQLATFLATDPTALRARAGATYIVPPVSDFEAAENDTGYFVLGDPRVLYRKLARRASPQPIRPRDIAGWAQLSRLVSAASNGATTDELHDQALSAKRQINRRFND